MIAKANKIDDQGTTQDEARELLQNLLTNGFDDEIDLLSQALGRPSEEILDAIQGNEQIDEDLLMKVRGIIEERNLKVDK